VTPTEWRTGYQQRELLLTPEQYPQNVHIHSLADSLRESLPRPIWDILRKTANSVLGPVHFSFETGHLRSSLKSGAVDRHGQPLPWYTYPAIQTLLRKDFSQMRVLEWGGGQSTLFWAKRAGTVTTLESDPEWYDWLSEKLSSKVSLHLVKEDISDAEEYLRGKNFEIIVIDGLDRWKCAKRSVDLLAHDGLLIVDDAERNCGPKPGYGFIELYREAGLSRIDFFGYSPGNTTQHCTSMFFRDSCFLIRDGRHPVVTLSYWEIT